LFIDYYLDYAAIPTESATDAFVFAFIDTDGATQLKAVTPFAFDATDKGYGRGMAWIHFTAGNVTALGIDSANIALYEVWVYGNPTLAWSAAPPKTTAGIDGWMPSTAVAATVLSVRVLDFARTLELAWTEDLVEQTALGNRLTADGEYYFTNAIQDLRTMTSVCFSSGTSNPTLVVLDYSTTFGAVMTDVTGTCAGSPITLASGVNNVNVTGIGTFTLVLEQGTSGTATTDVGIVTGSPVDLVAGTNTITTTGIGNIVVTRHGARLVRGSYGARVWLDNAIQRLCLDDNNGNNLCGGI